MWKCRARTFVRHAPIKSSPTFFHYKKPFKISILFHIIYNTMAQIYFLVFKSVESSVGNDRRPPRSKSSITRHYLTKCRWKSYIKASKKYSERKNRRLSLSREKNGIILKENVVYSFCVSEFTHVNMLCKKGSIIFVSCVFL